MVSKVLAYRRHVDAHMSTLLKSGLSAETAALLRLGLAHEEQHQELLLMDLLHLSASRPRGPPTIRDGPRTSRVAAADSARRSFRPFCQRR